MLLAPALLIIGAGTLVYVQVNRFDFVFFDDNEYVFQNSQVLKGLTTDSIRWAFTTLQSKHWHPVTWLSHMLDVELFELNPAGHHLMNLGLHLLTACLLFRFLFRATGEFVPTLLLALAFTVHPLHVENVAWVASRKDLLCALFWVITLNAYLSYVQNPCIKRYTLVLFTFCLAAMAKSMAVTLPLVLLLLDFWPLSRPAGAAPFPQKTIDPGKRSLGWLAIEKLPFLAISMLVGLLTLHALHSQYIHTPAQLPIGTSWVQGPKAYLVYLAKLVYPVDLITPYPLAIRISFWVPAFCGALAILITAVTIYYRRLHPYLLVGWAWYLVTLAPVSGFFGPPRIANRYPYIPLIGIYILLFFGGAAIARHWPRLKKPLLITAIVFIGLWSSLASRQAGTWRDTLTLFRHTLAVNPYSSIAHVNIGIYHYSKNRIDEAIRHQAEAVKLVPLKAEYHYNLGISLLKKRKYQTALDHFTTATRLRPDYYSAMSNRGLCLMQLGRLEAARIEFERVISGKPDHAHTHNHLGRLYAIGGSLSKAEKHFRKAISANQNYGDALANLAATLATRGQHDRAENYYRKAIHNAPDNPDYYFGLANLLTSQKKFKAAAETRILGLTRSPGSAEQQYFLAVDHYFTGDLELARQHLLQAKRMGYAEIEKLFEEKLARALPGDQPRGPD